MNPQETIALGVIGGTGIYDMNGFQIEDEVSIDTPFGDPSDAVILGRLGDSQLAFLSRHGRGHRHIPHEINYRANIFALKSLGVERVLSISAVGSMKEEIQPGDMVVVDQFFDRTRARPSTFFQNGLVAHVGFGDPVCSHLSRLVVQAAQASGAQVHESGTYLCIDGPQFSTRAESQIYRSWGIDVIGMTNLPEAKLAREAELCFSTLALVTDYDCWHEEEEDVTVDSVLKTIQKNTQRAKDTIADLVRQLSKGIDRECRCSTSLQGAIMTAKERVDPALQKMLGLLVHKYLK